MLTVEYDEATGIVVTIARGLSTTEDFDHYLPLLCNLMSKSAARHGIWLHLVDATENPVQPREATEHVTAKWNARPREDGYTAYIVQSALARMQIQRMRDNANKAFFADTESARAWLLEQIGPARRSGTN